MAADDTEAFLTEQASGVLCLADERRAYGVPVAFAYDGENERVVLNLGFAPESKKREFIETTEEACLTAYEWSATHDWKSVIIHGTLAALDDSAINEETESWFHTVTADIDVEEQNLALQWYELRVSELSGRRSHS